MKRYEYLEHTADVKFKAYGKTTEERFSNAATAMTEIMFNTKEIDQDLKKEINVKGTDMKQLLYNWLEELLFLLDTEFFILKSVEKMKIERGKEGFRLKARVVGSKFKEKYEHKGSVKAATYAEMEISKEYVQVVVDT